MRSKTVAWSAIRRDAVNLPRVTTAERMYLTDEEVHALAHACGEYRLPTLFLAYTGVRFGEMAALRVGRMDFVRRRALPSGR